MFRFEELEIWKRGIEVMDRILDIADKLEKRGLYRFAEQMRGAGLSVVNNIAEGSGCDTKLEFKKFLGYSRRSIYEVVSMLKVFKRRGYIDSEEDIVAELEELSRMTMGFKKTL
ncbi:MAG: four helix bundle protein [Thermodesulfovibrionales bacterium]|nr:four helix bundle protein [Thermodesulfovibrionales bacterium]